MRIATDRLLTALRRRHERDAHKSEKPAVAPRAFHKFYPGDVLLSHAVAHAVSSAMRSLTAVFGMGTGVSSAL